MNTHIIEKTQIREFVTKYLYHLFLKNLSDKLSSLKEDEEMLKEDFRLFTISYLEEDKEHPNNDLSPKITDKALKMVSGILKKSDILEPQITVALNKRSYEKLDMMEKAILLLGAYELEMKTAPKSVIINEAINISKKYCSKDSYSLINGVLDAIKETE